MSSIYHRQLGPVFGQLWGYYGSFQAVWRAVGPGQVPPYALPRRHESRE